MIGPVTGEQLLIDITRDSKKDRHTQPLSAGELLLQANPIDFGQGFYQGTIGKPAEALGQLAGIKADNKTKDRPETVATKAGVMAGQIVDFSILALATHGALKPLLKESINQTVGTSAKMFAAGAIDGGLLTSSSEQKSLLRGRLENGLVGGATFAFMGGAGKALEGVNLVENAVVSKVAGNVLSGAGGGVVSAFGNAFTQEHRLAHGDEIISSAAQYAAFSLGFHALGEGASKLVEQPKVSSAIYNTKWELGKGALEVKRQSYVALDALNMRHPLYRLGDLVYGSPKVELPKPPITAENHPITAFEQRYQSYIDRMLKAEENYLTAPRGEKHDAFQAINEVKADFASDLMGVYRGSSDRPGILAFSDKELAQASGGLHTVERITAIRQALEAPMKPAAYGEQSAFEQAMAALGKGELESVRDPFELTVGLDSARQKFYKYDEHELIKKLALGSPYHEISREPQTPISWMPFEPTATLANLFHCTTSRSLANIFEERAMLSSKEMREKAIKQVAGESANEQFPRRAVSMTRDFSVAFCYSRHGPTYLADFPAIFGISRDVTSRAWSAGFTERGEILIDRLKLGTGWLQKLGLKKPEITHLYVPDAQVPFVSQSLAAHRIKGVNVVGLNHIDTPVWKPAEEELKKLGFI